MISRFILGFGAHIHWADDQPKHFMLGHLSKLLTRTLKTSICACLFVLVLDF